MVHANYSHYPSSFSLLQSLLSLHECAGKHGDPHLADFLETHYLGEQVDAAKELSELANRMRRAGDGLGLVIIDKEMKEKAE